MKRRLFAAFAIGVLVGSGLVTWWVGGKIDYLMSHNERLQGELDTKETQLRTMEESLKTQQKYVVSDMQIHIRFKNEKDEDEFTKMSLEKKVGDMLSDIWGKEVNTLDPILIANIVHNRKVIVEDTTYTLTVTRGPLISEKVMMFVEVEKSSEREQSEQ
ncbi:hypothetical protein GGQ84_001739 [Desulfitispora alkaliphila]|uniref:hypothetical protein n=1 Tax=Desulfitispora alkaliphila TaxID=622674 RepID=UPI003D1C6528